MNKVKSESVLALAGAVVKNLAIDDAGRVEKFFTAQIENFEFKVKQLNTNKQTLELVHSNDILTIDKKIEDAKGDLSNAYLDVTPEKVQNNAQIATFGDAYWAKVEAAQKQVTVLEKEKTQLEETYKSKIAEAEALIQKLQDRISIIKTWK